MVWVSARYLCQGRYSRGQRRWTVDLAVDAEDKIAFDGGAQRGRSRAGGLATEGRCAMAAAGLRANMLNDEKKGRLSSARHGI